MLDILLLFKILGHLIEFKPRTCTFLNKNRFSKEMFQF